MHCACTILLHVALQALKYFSTLSHRVHDFRGKKKVFGHKIVFQVSVQILSEIFFILRRTERDMIESVRRSSCKVLVILVRL